MIINQKINNKSKINHGVFRDWSLENKYVFLRNIYFKEFEYKYNSFQEERKNILIEKERLDLINNYDKLHLRFRNLLETLEEIIQSKLSINKFFNLKVINKRILKRATFFNEMELFLKHLSKRYINFENLFHNSKKPKRLNHKYTSYERRAIYKYIKNYLECCKNNGIFFNKTTIWLKIRKEGVLKEYGDFSSITYSTLVKIYSQESGETLVSNIKYSSKHPPRQDVKELGHTQMDLKVLGLGETSVGKYVYVFDLIDTSSRFVFSEVLESATVECVVKALLRGIEYFDKFNIKIKTMQTDNAMMFKKTNFVNSNSFHEILKQNNIRHRRIKLGNPQSNGVVERYHKTIDCEAHSRLIKCKTIEEVNVVIKDFMNYYNFERYHYYYEFSKIGNKLPHADRFMLPYKTIQFISCYHLNNQSKMSM